jgi:hypothetical protein
MTSRASDGVRGAPGRNDATVPSAIPVCPPSQELSLDQLFAEPIVQQLMRRDKIDEATTRRLLQQAMAARSTPKLRSVPFTQCWQLSTTQTRTFLGMYLATTYGRSTPP